MGDKTEPEILLVHEAPFLGSLRVDDDKEIQHVHEVNAGDPSSFLWIQSLTLARKGFVCIDACDGDISASAVKVSWHSDSCSGQKREQGAPTTPGRYAIQYQCEDAAGNKRVECHT